MLKRLAAIAFAIVFLTGICATAARADGDPASDVLYTQWTFVPTDAGVPAPQRSRLMALATEARKVRLPIKIAIISSSYDLGSIASSGGDLRRTRAFSAPNFRVFIAAAM